MKNITFIITLLLTTYSFSQEIASSKKYEIEILEIKDDKTLKEISRFYLSKKGISDVQFTKKNSDFFIVITTTMIVDQNSINILNNSAFNIFNLQSKQCDHEKI